MTIKKTRVGKKVRVKRRLRLKIVKVKPLRKKRRVRRKLPLAPIIQSHPAPAQAVIQSGTVPVVFIHRGDDDYLAYSLQQAKRSNPQSDIILIGDSANSKYASESVQHFMIDDYHQAAQQFAAVYKHQSPNSYEYELFCYQRWFILQDFVRANDIERFCSLDSDVMLYTDINNPEYHQFTNVWVMLTLNTKSTLDDLCYLIDIYFRKPDLFEHLQAYTQRLGYHGLNDMVFSNLFLHYWPQYKQNLDGVFQDSFFDGNISHPLHVTPRSLEESGLIDMLDGKKKVYRINGGLYAKAGADRWIRINSLHFQADSKKYMSYFLAPDLHAGNEQICYFDYSSNQWHSLK